MGPGLDRGQPAAGHDEARAIVYILLLLLFQVLIINNVPQVLIINNVPRW